MPVNTTENPVPTHVQPLALVMLTLLNVIEIGEHVELTVPTDTRLQFSLPGLLLKTQLLPTHWSCG